MKLGALGVLALGVLALNVQGCGSRNSNGTIASEGDRINTWQTTFQGCTRAPFDALPPDKTRSILTFVWQDPAIRNSAYDMNYQNPPDYPMRLEFSRGDQGSFASLHTLRHGGIRLDAKTCSTFEFKTKEYPVTAREGRPSLSGDLALECGAQYGHITAQLHFEGCKF